MTIAVRCAWNVSWHITSPLWRKLYPSYSQPTVRVGCQLIFPSVQLNCRLDAESPGPPLGCTVVLLSGRRHFKACHVGAAVDIHYCYLSLVSEDTWVKSYTNTIKYVKLCGPTSLRLFSALFLMSDLAPVSLFPHLKKMFWRVKEKMVMIESTDIADCLWTIIPYTFTAVESVITGYH